MRQILRTSTVLLVAAALTGCAHRDSSRPLQRNSDHGASLVIQATELERTELPVLEMLVGRVGNLRVQHTSHCPVLTLRGVRRIQGPSNPGVYLDGVRAVNTCLLQSLRAADLSRVEIYPMGVTRRPGYAAHAFGLILLFSRRAGS